MPEHNSPHSLIPFPYQIQGAEWLASKRWALLADQMRLGKTIQSILAADMISAKRVLVICRAVACSQWKAEFLLWSSLPRQLVVLSYEMALKMDDPSQKWDLIIVDESHALKNPSAKRTQSILGNNGLIRRTRRLWMLTGTPAPNNASELWTTLFTFGETKLKYDAFIQRFCNTFDSGYGLQITGTKTDVGTLNELRQLLSTVMLRRTTAEVASHFSEPFHTTQFVKTGPVFLSECFPKELALYGLEGLKRLIEEELGIYNSIVGSHASHELVEVLKASAKSISTLRRFTAMQKVEALVELVTTELMDGAYSKVVIFCIHVSAAQALLTRLSQFSPVAVVGGTVGAAEKVARFQVDPKCKVFVGNINAAGTSISLSAANHIYFLEESWVPGENAQAAMRCGGVNQKKPIFAKTILLENSVDIKVHQSVNRKTDEQKQIYGGLTP